MLSSLQLVDALRYEAQYRKVEAVGDPQQMAIAAEKCASAYSQLGDATKEWDYYYLVAKAQILLGTYSAALRTVSHMMQCAATEGDVTLKVRSLILRAAALRNKSQHERAIASAREALALLDVPSANPQICSDAYQGLIACLVEADRIDDAWALRDPLTKVLERVSNTAAASQGHWTLGNVAFAYGEHEQGTAHHELAAELLAAVNDIHAWARFNKGVADVRIQAGITDAHTLHCIDRSQIAYDVIGGTESERIGLAATRARWNMATGNLLEASETLRKVLDVRTGSEDSEHVSVHLLWAEILTGLERHEQARHQRSEAERIQGLAALGRN
ncbi:hypothetical protein [Paeniglutamicibacter cryotolerans]|uniref:Tetratricopeptide (TPR) repeat protein n=1 Tax=Paeniglutamicibacter cryotolerans TaxID=670079 RepID=A0A839QLN5_9MICC|nr:hypothetical protein [Paeniglutamicibacter cryotolerans]MBB2994102.1 tetratricopeptide (TPR) repeat protein [Paeniglutamicibacter cryotolerans]